MMTPIVSPSPAETKQLIAILEEMFLFQQQLLLILQEEKSLIIDGKTDHLVSCVGKKEGVLNRIAQLEAERIQMMSPISPASSPLTLKALIPHLPLADQEKLETLRSGLEVLTTSIAELNEMNGILIERVLGQISDLFSLLRHMTSGEKTYQATGEISLVSSGRSISKG